MTFDKAAVFGLTWSADGKKIIFSSHRDGGQSLWAVSLAGGEPERLPVGGAAATDPTISRKGDRLAYTQGTIHPNLWSIAVSKDGRKVTGGPSQFLFSAAYNNAPQFSPDGKRLAFTSERSGYNEIWTCDATDCSEPQQLTFLKVVSGMPRWSPDSKQIVFDSRPTGHSRVMMISAEGNLRSTGTIIWAFAFGSTAIKPANPIRIANAVRIFCAVLHFRSSGFPAFGRAPQKTLATPQRLYSQSCRAMRPCRRGCDGRRSACNTTVF
jgi:Tol biopolymer transport system component